MKTPNERATAPLWKAPPTSKTRNAVQRAVTALLDDLAPERALKRSDEIHVPIEQHRTPTGCVLQAEKAALSVSWFATTGNDPVLGELRVVVWRGTVSRRGSPRRKEGATVVSETVLRPIEDPSSECVWRGTAGPAKSPPNSPPSCPSLLVPQVGNVQ